MQNNDNFSDVFFEDDAAPHKPQKRPSKMYQRIGYTLIGIGLLTAGWFGYKYFGGSSPKTTQYCIAKEEAPACGSQERVVYELKNALEPRTPVATDVFDKDKIKEYDTLVVRGVKVSFFFDEEDKEDKVMAMFASRDTTSDVAIFNAMTEDTIAILRAFKDSGYAKYDDFFVFSAAPIRNGDDFLLVGNEMAAGFQFERDAFEAMDVSSITPSEIYSILDHTSDDFLPTHAGWFDMEFVEEVKTLPAPALGTKERLEYELKRRILGGTFIKNIPRVHPLSKFSHPNADIVIGTTSRYTPDVFKQSSVEDDFKRALEALRISEYPYEKVVLLEYSPLADEYGNAEWGYSAYVLFDKATVDKINFATFDSSNIHKIALEWQANNSNIFWW